MEEMPPAVALSFRTANSTCDNSMEIACLKLITETAGLLPNPMDAAATGLSPEVEQSEVVAMEEGGDGDDLDVRRAVGSFHEDLVSMERKFLGGIACSAATSIGGSSRSINSTADELLDMDLPSETCTPTALEVEKSGRSAKSGKQQQQQAKCVLGGLLTLLGASVNLWTKARDGRCCCGSALFL